MRTCDYFEAHPVFTHREFVAAHTAEGRSRHTSNNLLALHLAARRLTRVRRGIYAVVPRGVEPGSPVFDPYLVVSKLADDAVVAYHGALQFFGKAHSVWRRFHYLTARRAKPFASRGLEFVPVLKPSAAGPKVSDADFVAEVRHAGGHVRVTTLERTLVDVLDQPDKGGGWEEIWRSLELIEFFDLDAVIAYSKVLGSAVTAARVGFFLEQHAEELMVEGKHLEALEGLAPSQARYLDGARQPGKLVKRWNLVVPEFVLERRWEEAG